MPLNEGSYFNRMEIAWGKMIDGFMGRDGERWRPLPCWWMDRWYAQWGGTQEDSILDQSTRSALICRLPPTSIFYTRTHTHTHKHTRAHTHTHVRTHTHTCSRVHTAAVNKHIYTRVRLRIQFQLLLAGAPPLNYHSQWESSQLWTFFMKVLLWQKSLAPVTAEFECVHYLRVYSKVTNV